MTINDFEIPRNIYLYLNYSYNLLICISILPIDLIKNKNNVRPLYMITIIIRYSKGYFQIYIKYNKK